MHRLARFLRQVSLRSKLVALMGVLMVCAIVVTAVGTSQSLRLTLIAQTDADLAGNSGALADIMYTEYSNAGTSGGLSNIDLLRFHGTLRDADGNNLYVLPSTSGPDAPVLNQPTLDEVRMENGRAFDVPGTQLGSSGWRVRMVALKNGTGYITIALPLKAVNAITARAAALIMSTGMLATIVMSMVAYGITSRALRPLQRVERTAAAIAAGDLSRRVEEYPPETEVGRLSRSLNAMLAHIEHAFRARATSERKMRRFIQDASHELRTPLVTIQGYSELYRHGGLSEPEQVATAMGRIEGEAKRMGQLVEDLLTLARLDERRPLDLRPLDLMLLAMDAVGDARVSAPERQVRLVGLDDGPPRNAPITGDEARLRQVVANLMTNALRYTPADSPIEIAVGVLPVIDGQSDAVLEVRDHGPGISEDDAARVFERFYRADSSRQRETGGTGLGLAIVAAIVAQHQGSVRLTDTPGGGATMAVHLPMSAFEPPSPEPTED